MEGPVWQLVLVLWGTKYPVEEVNFLIRTVCEHTSRKPRVVLITDQMREGLADGVVQRLIPEFFLQPELRGGGCQAKLCMFEGGIVPPDLPAIFIDIDTVVFGDLTSLLALQETPKTVAMLQSAVLPFGALARALYRLTKRRRYARGNSSILIYRPAECTHIAARFRELYGRHGNNGIRPMIADERFMSWANQPYMRAIPNTLAVKMPTEFMLPWPWLIRLRAALPWVCKRWAGLIAVTLPGVEVKGKALLALPEGGQIIDRKGRRLIWSEAALGGVKSRLTAHYRALQHNKGEQV